MRLIVAFLMIVFLVSCENKTLKDARQVKVGMTTQDLVYIMGDPLTVEVNDDNEEWYFTYYSGDYKSRMVVYVKNNKIESFSSY